MTMRPGRLALPTLLALAAILAKPPPAGAYGERIHRALPALALDEGALGPVAPGATPQDLGAFRAWLYGLGVATPDGALRERILARFPDEASFVDPRAFKELLSMNPEAEVFGVDRTAGEVPARRGDLLAAASAHPDDDRRNQDRFARDADGRVRVGPDGQPLPADPAILWMGRSTGVNSQAHAHYGLTRKRHSDDPGVLKTEPERFTVPVEAMAFGAELAEAYALLAFAASRFPSPARDHLVGLYEGAAFHHVQDVCNQVHAIQVGIYDFFVSAKLQSLVEDLVTGGGLLRSRRGFRSIGIGIISNHHLMSEELWADRVEEVLAAGPAGGDPEVRRAVEAARADDPDLLADLDRDAPGGTFAGFGRALAQAVVERSAPEGAEVYRRVFTFAPGLRSRHVAFDAEADDPEPFVADPADPEVGRALGEFYALQGRGFSRAGTAMRAFEARLAAFRTTAPAPGGDAAPDPALRAVVDAFFRARLDAADEAAARLAAWVPEPESDLPVSWWVLGIYALPLGAVAAALWRRRTRRPMDRRTP
ncbi:hypothetical protein L6R50_27240 [Myxococcota bacterium]|nr:hypothetical protein [Myxococcota bacterium]